MTAVDRGRAEVYAAELAAYEGTDLEEVAAFDELVALADTGDVRGLVARRPRAGQARSVRRRARRRPGTPRTP